VPFLRHPKGMNEVGVSSRLSRLLGAWGEAGAVPGRQMIAVLASVLIRPDQSIISPSIRDLIIHTKARRPSR